MDMDVTEKKGKKASKSMDFDLTTNNPSLHRPVQFTADDINVINDYPVKSSHFVSQLSLITPETSTEVALYTYMAVLGYFVGLQPAQVIKLADSSKTMAERLGTLVDTCFEQTKSPNGLSKDEFLRRLKPHFDSLVESQSFDLDIWTAVANLLMDFNTPTVPEASSTSPSATPPEGYYKTSDQSVLNTLHGKWIGDYLPESLSALQDEIRSHEESISKGLHIYAKTLLLVQSTGMGKSRLADKFGETCPMINFTLGEENFKCYPPIDEEVRSFFRKEMPKEAKDMVCATPSGEQICSMIIPERLQSKTPTPQTPKSNRQTEEDQEMTIECSSLNKVKESLPISREYKRFYYSRRKVENFNDNLATMTWYHARAAAFLMNCFKAFSEWVDDQSSQITLETLATIRHQSMAPYDPTSGERNPRNPWNRRSAYRTEFCEDIVARAEKTSKALLEREDWRRAFHDDGQSQVRRALEDDNSTINTLKATAKKLIDNLRKFQRENVNNNDPLLVVVFDEASALLKQDKSKFDPGLYHALNRIISCLKEFPIWFFFLSTESQLRMFLPTDDTRRTGNYVIDPTSRKPKKGNTLLKRPPPFLAFQLDVEDRRRMQQERQHERAMCLNKFATPEQMAKFGRPLWYAYEPSEMNDLAKLKLVGGKGDADDRAPYDPTDVNHVFAALSFRLSLDPCLQNPRSHSLVRIAVNSFMRVIISIDPETGTMDTITPSEPVVAQAAMEFLCEKNIDMNNWSLSIGTLTKELLQKTLVEKGLKGELYSRLVLTLARDSVWKDQVELRQTQTFTVGQFLTKLYAENHYQKLQCIPTELLGARMNFNHFVPTSGFLKPDVLPELLHDLLRRCAGMQLAGNQTLYDIMIPIYFSDPAKQFNQSECGVILIQVKNKNVATTLQKIFGEDFWDSPSDSKEKANSDNGSISVSKNGKKADSGNKNKTLSKKRKKDDSDSENIRASKKIKMDDSEISVLENVKGPILFLLFDLGTKPGPQTPPFYVSHNRGKNSEKVTIWAVHSRGNDSTIFGCLRHMNCESSSQTFFTSMNRKTTASDPLCQRNKIFSPLQESFRYPYDNSSSDSSSDSGQASGLASGSASFRSGFEFR